MEANNGKRVYYGASEGEFKRSIPLQVERKPRGGGVLPYKGLMGTCGQPGYVFRDFYLEQGILNRVSPPPGRKQSKHTRQRSAVATLSFTPVGDLQATGSSNLLQEHINKGDI